MTFLLLLRVGAWLGLGNPQKSGSSSLHQLRLEHHWNRPEKKLEKNQRSFTGAKSIKSPLIRCGKAKGSGFCKGKKTPI